jgi:hypothetical protein
MTSISFLFSSYNFRTEKKKVRIANGSPSSMSSKGSIPVTPYMTLSYVLHVPDFAPYMTLL